MSRSEERPGVVLDTMVIFQATASPAGPAAELLRRLEAGWFTPYISAEILDEVRDVLSRPKIQAKYRGSQTNLSKPSSIGSRG